MEIKAIFCPPISEVAPEASCAPHPIEKSL